MTQISRLRRLLFALSLLLASLNSPAQQITLNFVDADIDTVVRTIGQATKKNFVLDARVQGNITLNLDKPVSPLQALNALQSALRTRGFAMIENDGLIRVVPESEAPILTNRVQSAGNPAPANLGNVVVTQIFKLRHETPESLLGILRPLVSPSNSITVSPSTNSLVITDYADNLRRIGRIIDTFDVADSGYFDVVQIKNASALELASTLSRILENGQNDALQRVIIVAETRTNALLLRSRSNTRLATTRDLIAKLDTPNVSQSRVHVLPLKNADATKLAETLRAVVGSEAFNAVGSIDPQGTTAPANNPTAQNNAANRAAAVAAATNAASSAGTFANSNSKVSIQAYAASNTLVITASDEVFRNLKEIIEKLDTRRAQVFVEALVVEVNADKANELGLQWQSGLGIGGDNPLILGTNFASGGNNILGLLTATTPTLPGRGLNVAAGGVQNGKVTLGALARALSTQVNANVLSTPTILTLDNEEAKIVVGQNVPFVTGQFTQTGGSVSSPFQTIERKDVGITLRVKPQISANGSVKMTIFHEASSLSNIATIDSTNLQTNKRSLESNVIIEDGQIIVLGGLISDSTSETIEKVPLLGDIPYLGALFRYRTSKQTKTNLMVFLRPTVVRDPQTIDPITAQRYQQIRDQFGGAEINTPWPELRRYGSTTDIGFLQPIRNGESRPKVAP